MKTEYIVLDADAGKDGMTRQRILGYQDTSRRHAAFILIFSDCNNTIANTI
jgi:hypothetical protein